MHVLYSFPDRVGAPGIGTIAYQHVREVIAAGVDVSLYCTTLERDIPGVHTVVETMRVAGKRVPHRALGIPRSYGYHDMRVARAIKRRGEPIEVVHTWPRATLSTAKAARERGVPIAREVPNTHTAHAFDVVAREHARIGLPVSAENSHAFDAKVLATEEAEFAAVDALLVPSQFVYDSFLAADVPADRLSLQQYGFDPDRFYPGPADRKGAGKLTGIFVGRCEPRKGLHLALEAWTASTASDHGTFRICGSFAPGYREYLEPLLAHPSVEVLGFVADPGELMRQSDVFLFPSIEEGSALVTYEARASGCVLLVSEATGARCRNEVEGFVHRPGDVAALTTQLSRIDSDRDLLSRMREASLAGIDGLTWSAAGRALVETYSRLAGQG